MDFNRINEIAIDLLLDFGFKLLGGIILWVIGQRVIGFVQIIIRRSFRGKTVDPTVINYLVSFVGITLRITLVIAILSFLGIQTTSFAALLAAGGVAIGAAWGGILANFAAGLFLIVFRPFRVGDYICAAGVTGIVCEIGLFSTTMNTQDNVMTIVSNNKLFGNNIENYSTNSYRRIDLSFQLDSSVDVEQAIATLQSKIAQIPHVMADPAPVVDILALNPTGTVLAIRPCCHNDYYWQVYFATNRTIYHTFGNAGTPPPTEDQSLAKEEENLGNSQEV